MDKERRVEVEEVTIAGKPVRLVHDEVAIDKIHLDEDKRLRWRLASRTMCGRSRSYSPQRSTCRRHPRPRSRPRPSLSKYELDLAPSRPGT